MMIWYTAHYGTWADAGKLGGGVQSVQYGKHEWETGTFDRKEAFSRAQEVANETGKGEKFLRMLEKWDEAGGGDE